MRLYNQHSAEAFTKYYFRNGITRLTSRKLNLDLIKYRQMPPQTLSDRDKQRGTFFTPINICGIVWPYLINQPVNCNLSQTQIRFNNQYRNYQFVCWILTKSSVRKLIGNLTHGTLTMISIVALIIIAFITIVYAATTEFESNCELYDSSPLAVVCTNLNSSTVGESVDKVIQPIVSFNDYLQLELRSIEFTNGRIEPNWYTGHNKIYIFIFYLGCVTFIADNAFNSPAFRWMAALSLVLENFTEFNGGIFNGLNNLRSLDIHSKNGLPVYNIYSPIEPVLEPLRKTLEYYMNIISNRPLKDYFGKHRMSRLFNVSVSNTRDMYYPRVLSKEDFTGLSTVFSVILNYCSIHAILENTFDYIGETINELDLGMNNIKQLTFDLLYTFLDIPPRHWASYKLLYMGLSQLKCDCDFYLMKNVTLISFGYTSVPDNFIGCDKNWLVSTLGECETVQLIQPKRFHLVYPFSERRPYAYLKFQLNLIEGQAGRQLMIRQTKGRRYRVWIMNTNGGHTKKIRKCPNREWIAHSAKCLRFSSTAERFPIENYLTASRLTIICIVYLQYPQKVWPLHCITIFNSFSCHDCQWIFLDSVCWIIPLIVFAGLSMGLASTWLCKAIITVNESEECPDDSISVAYDDYFSTINDGDHTCLRFTENTAENGAQLGLYQSVDYYTSLNNEDISNLYL